MKVALAQQAVDAAFINHVSGLFVRYCKNIQEEGAGRNPVTSHARQEFEKEYALAVITHTEMTKHVNAQA